MPYCVNCGVKISPEIHCCPLCGAEVVHPEHPIPPVFHSSQPTQREVPQKAFDKRLWINLMSVLLAAPAAVLLAADWIFGSEITWSRYVIGSLIVVWVWCVSPFLFSHNITPLWITIDAGALLGFLFFVEMISPSQGWFFRLALPTTLGSTFLLLALIILFQRKILRQLHKAAALFFTVGILFLQLEFFIDRYTLGRWQPGWSLLVFIGCAAFALVAVVLQRRRWIVEEIKYWLRM